MSVPMHVLGENKQMQLFSWKKSLIILRFLSLFECMWVGVSICVTEDMGFTGVKKCVNYLFLKILGFKKILVVLFMCENLTHPYVFISSFPSSNASHSSCAFLVPSRNHGLLFFHYI